MTHYDAAQFKTDDQTPRPKDLYQRLGVDKAEIELFMKHTRRDGGRPGPRRPVDGFRSQLFGAGGLACFE